MKYITQKIAKAQITEGGPVILFQTEDEYAVGKGGIIFPNHAYMQHMVNQARDNGIVVPLMNNNPGFTAVGAPGRGPGAVDIYGTNVYPKGFNCGLPNDWPRDSLPEDLLMNHRYISRNTPLAVTEIAGGSSDSWGGPGFEGCDALYGNEFERVVYKDVIASGATIFNVYMAFGGTNWGNLGHSGGYTSNDYGAAIREDRSVDREKYSELKLQGQFLKVSPGLLAAVPSRVSLAISSNAHVRVTALLSKEHLGNFFVVRHEDYSHNSDTTYTIQLPTSKGNVAVPQLGGHLVLRGHDSKWHVTDYPVGDYILRYCTAEIFTWKKFHDQTVLVLYGELNELHELELENPLKVRLDAEIEVMEGHHPKIKRTDNHTITIQWHPDWIRTVIRYGELDIHLLHRDNAYKYWVPTLPAKGRLAAYGTSLVNTPAVIVNGGYLVRSASVKDATLSLRVDLSEETTLEIIGAPADTTKLKINGEKCNFHVSHLGYWIATPKFDPPAVELPDLGKLQWRQLDSLPEIRKDFDDSNWVEAKNRTTSNSVAPLKTPVSLYGSDYGFHSGTLVFRGYFEGSAFVKASTFELETQGGAAFASSVWVDDHFLGSFNGQANVASHVETYHLDGLKLLEEEKHVLTVVVDTTGLNQNYYPGEERMKEPRGILNYTLLSTDGREIPISLWKIAGNLGGETYRDKGRGPLNEGGLFFERQGYHLPSPKEKLFTKGGSPLQGIPDPGIVFYSAKLKLDLKADKYDIPLYFEFDNSTDSAPYRAFLYVNGFQYGKYISHLGPQLDFPVPEGILNYQGDNWIGIGLWAMEEGGAAIQGLRLRARAKIWSGRNKVELVAAVTAKVSAASGTKDNKDTVYDPWLGEVVTNGG